MTSGYGGFLVGTTVGAANGLGVGAGDSLEVGTAVETDGEAAEGLAVGHTDGHEKGSIECLADGDVVGAIVGMIDGASVRTKVMAVRMAVESEDSHAEGSRGSAEVGNAVGVAVWQKSALSLVQPSAPQSSVLRSSQLWARTSAVQLVTL